MNISLTAGVAGQSEHDLVSFRGKKKLKFLKKAEYAYILRINMYGCTVTRTERLSLCRASGAPGPKRCDSAVSHATFTFGE